MVNRYPCMTTPPTTLQQALYIAPFQSVTGSAARKTGSAGWACCHSACDFSPGRGRFWRGALSERRGCRTPLGQETPAQVRPRPQRGARCPEPFSQRPVGSEWASWRALGGLEAPAFVSDREPEETRNGAGSGNSGEIYSFMVRGFYR